MSATTQTAQDCPDCAVELIAIIPEGMREVDFECPNCGDRFYGRIDDTGEGFAYVLEGRVA